MAHAKITLIGFHKYSGGHIWDKLVLPKGIDKETLCNNIMMEFGEDEVFYSDISFFTDAVGVWSKKWYRTIERWVKLINTEYEPLWNIDRFEDVTDTPDITTTATGNAHSTDNTHSTDTADNVHSRNTYDDDTWHETDKDESTDINTSDSVSEVYDSSTSHTGGSQKHKGHYYGNGGVTSSQKLFNEEKEVVKFNVYNEIAELFARDLLIDSFY